MNYTLIVSRRIMLGELEEMDPKHKSSINSDLIEVIAINTERDI